MPDLQAVTLPEIAARAQRHQDEIDRDVVFFTIADLAKRWRCAKATVRAFPFDRLPWTNMGHGLKRECRRYRKVDVEAFEAAGRALPRGRQRSA